MTFLEAAIEILRNERDPLHFSEITRRAVERKLLSHVGRDPEAAMQTCLNSAVRNNTHEGLLVRGKPGHYSLRAGASLPDLPPPPASRARTLPEVGVSNENSRKSKGLDRKTSTPSRLSAAPRRADDDEGSVAGGGDQGDGGGDDGDAKRRKKRSSRSSAVEVPTRKRSARGRGRGKTARERSEDDEREPAEPTPDAVEAEPIEDASDDEGTDADSLESDEADEPNEVDGDDEEDEAEDVPLVPIGGRLTPASLDPSKVRFRGPEGSGLESETDIALVMANAMSRLVEERPELRQELEAMQQRPTPTQELVRPASVSSVSGSSSGTLPGGTEVVEVRSRRREDRFEQGFVGSSGPKGERGPAREAEDERGGRRRRRRRRRSRRVDWSEGGASRAPGARSDELLDKVATVLTEAGTRSLHVRQIAETLASQNVLGGEISEIERAVTAALLLDVHRRGEASRFAVRGDARYQLRGSRLPEKAAAAEHAARRAILVLESETEKQLILWLQALGARALESLVRIWLEREDYALAATLPPSRGLGKLIAEDPEDEDGRTLVLIVPRKTALEPKLWDGEAERNACASTLVFAMGEGEESSFGDTRVIGATELARWLLRNQIGVRTIRFEVPVLDADLIEAVAGLDT